MPAFSDADPSGTDRAANAAPLPLRYWDARSAWGFAELGEVWQYRELLLVLIARDLKVRYRQAVIGVVWVVLQPVAMLGLFAWFFLGMLDRRPTPESTPFAASILAGLMGWQFFSSSVRDASNSLVQNRILLTKVYFPRLLLPLSAVGGALFDLAVAAVLLIAVMAFESVLPSSRWLIAPAFLVMLAAFAVAIAIWVSALNAQYRDVGYALPFLLQIGFFVSPIVYESGTFIPAEWRWLYGLNPLAGACDGIRWALVDSPRPAAESLFGAVLIVAATLAGGIVYFHRVDRWLADRI